MVEYKEMTDKKDCDVTFRLYELIKKGRVESMFEKIISFI